MVSADAALFTGLGYYFTGMAQVLRAELKDNEDVDLKRAAPMFEKALKQLETVRKHEERLLSLAQPIEESAYFVRRHEVASLDTEALLRGLKAITRDLADGYYPAQACGMLNVSLTRLMANLEQNARVEGVLSRLEGVKDTEQTAGAARKKAQR